MDIVIFYILINTLKPMKTLTIFLLGMLIFIATSCQKPKLPIEPKPIEVSKTTRQLIQNSNQFGLELFQTVLQHEDITKNVMVSPLSATLALAMTYNGAAGSTKTAFENVFHLNGLSAAEINQSMYDLSKALVGVDPQVILKIANSIWYRNTFSVESDFLNTNKKYYDAEVKALDFNNPNSKNIINSWVDEQTGHKIPTIVSHIYSTDIMFLINAIYFKGSWKSRFDKAQTENRPFYLPDGQTKDVPTMSQQRSFAGLYNDLFTAVELPYGRGNYSMILMLPNEDKTLKELEDSLTQTNWQTWMAGFGELGKIIIQLPKFKFDYARSMKDDLSRLGLGIAFSDTADFSKINPNVQLSISRVKQKTFIKVNEEGTEAAAATVVAVGSTSALPKIIAFNRPFLFVIKEKYTQAILFVGRVTDPSQTGE